MSVVIFTTGGTIDKVYFDAKGAFAVGSSMVRQIIERARVDIPIEIVELMRKDSLDLTDADRRSIVVAVGNAQSSQVLITHGTDTMVETADALTAVLNKTIVLTGALQPGRFTDSDADFNLGMAMAAVQTLPAGVYLAANGQIFRAGTVRKNRDANRFERIGS